MKHFSVADEGFCQRVAKGEDQSSAYRATHPRAAGWKPETVHARASELARKFSGRIAALRKEQQQIAEEEFGIDRRSWLFGVAKLAYYDPIKLFDEHGNVLPIHKIDPDTRQAIVGVDLYEDGKIKRYRMSPRTPAHEMIGRCAGAFLADNRQKTDGLMAAFLEFIAQNGRLQAVERVGGSTEVDITPLQVGALVPRG